MIPRPPLTLGIEEEYMIVDAESRALSSSVSEIMTRGRERVGDQIKAEFMQSQVEVGSRVCRDIHEVRREMTHLRRVVSEAARESNKRIAAAGTHPFSKVHEQTITEGERYRDLYADMQYVARRLLIFGMHVHLGFGTDDAMHELQIDIMNQLRYFLPHILTITTSSPFWHGRNTGLKSYRSVIFENLPRTGIPPVFNSYQEYDHMVEVFHKVGSLAKGGGKDPSRIWWDVRPSPRFGTLEVRVGDVCTTLDEAMCAAAVIQAIVAKLLKLRASNQSWRLYRTEFIRENKWRASRYGIEGDLVDYGIERAVPVTRLWEEILALVDDVVDDLGSRRDVEYVRTILAQGTSADRQLATYFTALDDGCTEEQAQVLVMDRIISETVQGIEG
ncbi:MAG: carboxylate-amine ligase [Anaerolineae bacterium]|nr:carboxylate-amine ligase [Anaerolineae bacterium]